MNEQTNKDKARRRRGTGSVLLVGKDSWRVYLYTGKGPDGKYHRQVETVKGRKSDAERRLRELLGNLDKGAYTPPGKLTVAQHLDNWLAGYVATNCSARTMDGYKSIIEHHLEPNLGHFLLRQLSPQAIQLYYGKACQELSARTVHHQHRVLSEALKYAVRQGLLGKNPCELVNPPKPRRNIMRTLDPSEVNALVQAAEDSYYFPVFYTALSTGLRQAELLALRWRDLDLGIIPSVSVNRVLYRNRRDGKYEYHEPKTAHSRRLVEMTPKLAAFLKGYRQGREALWRQLGNELSLDDLVFTNPRGNPICSSSLDREFSRILSKAGLKNVRFHDLRHTFASLMLLRGAKPKVISEALGDASVGFTMDVYSHIIQGMQAEAMILLDEVLPMPKNEISTTLAHFSSIMSSTN
jgi:integrase